MTWSKWGSIITTYETQKPNANNFIWRENSSSAKNRDWSSRRGKSNRKRKTIINLRRKSIASSEKGKNSSSREEES